MTQSEPNLGEQALSKAAELGITSQLDEVEKMDVDIRTDPLKLVQGKVDSVSITGEGMVMKQDLRMESMEINTGSVAIDPGSAIFGKVELTEPADADANIVLTETDLNRAFTSEYLRKKLQNLEVQLPDRVLLVNVRRANLGLPENETITIDADIFLKDTAEMKSFSAIAKPQLQDNGKRIDLEMVSAEGEDMSPELVTALFKKITEFLDLRNFDIKGMSLQLKNLVVQPGKLILQAATKIENFPSA
jgi:hypothetical protein